MQRSASSAIFSWNVQVSEKPCHSLDWMPSEGKWVGEGAWVESSSSLSVWFAITVPDSHQTRPFLFLWKVPASPEEGEGQKLSPGKEDLGL